MLESQYNHRNFPFVAPARETDPAEMAPEARWTETEHRDHLVQFYESEDFLASTVAEYARLGLEAGETFIVAATEQHIKQFERAIEASGVNVVSARSSGHFIELEARALLSKIMVDGMPDREQFNASIVTLIESIVDQGGRVRVFGELVALLVADGNADACIRLEEFWNELRVKHSFSLFCAYPTGGFPNTELAELVTRVCDQHARIIPDETYTMLQTPNERLKNIAFLQQRSKHLEAEIAELQRRIAAKSSTDL